MTSLLYKWILGKAIGKVQVGGYNEDPFFEDIPAEELGRFQKQGAKRKKPLPPGLSPKDQNVLRSVRSRAYNLDLSLSCCCGIQMGWAGIIGLIPWIGDFVAAYFSYLLVRKAQTIDGGLPEYIQTQMFANVAFDFGIGLIPIIGDLINIAYKANSRNCILLEEHLKKKAQLGSTNLGPGERKGYSFNKLFNHHDEQQHTPPPLPPQGGPIGPPPPPRPQQQQPNYLREQSPHQLV